MDWGDLLERRLLLPAGAEGARAEQLSELAWERLMTAREAFLQGDYAAADKLVRNSMRCGAAALLASVRLRFAHGADDHLTREVCRRAFGDTCDRIFERTAMLRELAMAEPGDSTAPSPQEAKRALAAASELLALVESHLHH